MNIFIDALEAVEPFEETDPPPDEQPRPELAFVPQSCAARGWDRSEPEPRRWVIQDVLPVGRVGGLFGAGGAGKSRLIGSAAVSIASGVQWLGFPVIEPGAVLIVAGEDEAEEFHRRIRLAINHLPQDRQKLAWDRIFFESRIGQDSLLTTTNPASREVERTAFLDRLIEAAKLIPDLRLIVLDPLSRFRGGDENASQDITRIVEAAEHLAKETGAAVLLVHHIGKSAALGGNDSQHAARGSSALVDGMRFAWNLGPLAPADIKRFALSEDRAPNPLTNCASSSWLFLMIKVCEARFVILSS
ncbi:MAG: AAA family ATPase [Magnetococcales bacterium]|nr:AAA family ATPase [Magnetococcales bacterium]